MTIAINEVRSVCTDYPLTVEWVDPQFWKPAVFHYGGADPLGVVVELMTRLVALRQKLDFTVVEFTYGPQAYGDGKSAPTWFFSWIDTKLDGDFVDDEAER